MSKTVPVDLKTRRLQVGKSLGTNSEPEKPASEVDKTVATLLEVLEAGAVVKARLFASHYVKYVCLEKRRVAQQSEAHPFQKHYEDLLVIISEIGKDVKPAYTSSKIAVDKLKKS